MRGPLLTSGESLIPSNQPLHVPRATPSQRFARPDHHRQSFLQRAIRASRDRTGLLRVCAEIEIASFQVYRMGEHHLEVDVMNGQTTVGR